MGKASFARRLNDKAVSIRQSRIRNKKKLKAMSLKERFAVLEKATASDPVSKAIREGKSED